MYLSSRVKGVSESITMQLNEKALQLAESGRVLLNLSAGQLPVKPPQNFIEKLHQQLNFLRSYQYSPVAGDPHLRNKIKDFFLSQRAIGEFDELDVIFSNGSKHSIYNALGAILDPGDEVILLVPYWVSYPEMIKFWGGVPVVVKSSIFDAFSPAIEDIQRVITPRTKAIIVNSPNNPAGIHYSRKWMEDFTSLVQQHSDIWIMSDEIYSDLSYFDPPPSYFYQVDNKLLERSIIINGISKSLASTGLRLGYTIGPKTLTSAMGKIQGQTTSGPSSLIQRALLEYSFEELDAFLIPVKNHLRKSANIIREKWQHSNLHNSWYQPQSAFYFMIDFSRTPCFERFSVQDSGQDLSTMICQAILEETGVSLVPGSDFGLQHSARMSLVMEEVPFSEAINKLVDFLGRK